MSQTISGGRTVTAPAPAPSALSRSVRWGLGSLAVGVAVAVYGAYGDPHPKSSQEHAVPFICGVLAVIAVAVFGALVPAGLRGIASRPGRWSGWALTTGIVALLATPVSFWSGLPVLLGTAAAVLGVAGRRTGTGGRGLPTAALTVGAFAAVASVVIAVLGNLTS